MAWIYGLSPTETEERSPAELLAYINAGRLKDQRQAFMLYSHAYLNRMSMDGKLPEIWEVFPFWSDEEIARFRMERSRSILMKHST